MRVLVKSYNGIKCIRFTMPILSMRVWTESNESSNRSWSNIRVGFVCVALRCDRLYTWECRYAKQQIDCWCWRWCWRQWRCSRSGYPDWGVVMTMLLTTYSSCCATDITALVIVILLILIWSLARLLATTIPNLEDIEVERMDAKDSIRFAN